MGHGESIGHLWQILKKFDALGTGGGATLIWSIGPGGFSVIPLAKHQALKTPTAPISFKINVPKLVSASPTAILF
jgi:hypothetical protein